MNGGAFGGNTIGRCSDWRLARGGCCSLGCRTREQLVPEAVQHLAENPIFLSTTTNKGSPKEQVRHQFRRRFFRYVAVHNSPAISSRRQAGPKSPVIPALAQVCFSDFSIIAPGFLTENVVSAVGDWTGR